jgi:hypothetical protein
MGIIGYCTAVVITLAVFAFTAYGSGGIVWQYLDIAAFLWVVIAPFLYQLAVCGASTVALAFRTAFNKDADQKEIKTAALFFQSYTKTVWLFAATAALISFVATLKNLEHRSALGPNLAVFSFSLLYGIVIHLIVIRPRVVFLRKLLITIEGEKK